MSVKVESKQEIRKLVQDVIDLVEYYLTEKLRTYENLPLSKEGLKYIVDYLNSVILKYGAKITTFRTGMEFKLKSIVSHQGEGRAFVDLALDVQGHKVTCYMYVPIESALVTAKLAGDHYYDAEMLIRLVGGGSRFRCSILD
jgi:hypothetical protein